MGRPIIGVSGRRIAGSDRILDGVSREYVTAVRSAGGIPVVLPAGPGPDQDGMVERIDGLLLSGGGDVDPACYGAGPDVRVGGVDAERDSGELALALAAVAAGRPVLGTCRGLQVLNVALGGTLVVDLADRTVRPHLVPHPRDALVHAVDVVAGSRLAGVIGASRLDVNSIHHQAVDRLATGLVVSACADDGVIEAVESRDGPVLAVQWHPESLPARPEQRRIFEWLVASAADRAAVG